MKLRFTLIIFLISNHIFAQNTFKIKDSQTASGTVIYSLVDANEKTIRILDTTKYFIVVSGDNYGYFAIVGKRGVPGWNAIDANENKLFQVYNTSLGELSPDHLIENKIRIVDSENKIGFANEKGEIIIRPQFEIVTSFHNGKAIIGATCKKIPWGNHVNEKGCNHYSIVCDSHGYIDEKGEILKIGNYSFEQIKNEINWQPEEE